jgi:hypothetical protein
MTETAQKIIAAAHRVSDGGVPLGKLIREGKTDPMSARVNYEYAAVLRTLAEELGYNNFNIDGDHGINVVNVKDILKLVDELEAL